MVLSFVQSTKVRTLRRRDCQTVLSHLSFARRQAPGFDRATFSGHSLRPGLAAAVAGVSEADIARTTGHRSIASFEVT